MNARLIIRCLSAAVIGLILGLGFGSGPVSAADAGLQIRTGLHKDFTRLVLETSEPVPYKFAFPAGDEIVVTVTGAVQPDRKAPPARGIIRHITVTAGEHGSRLIIKTKARADIHRQFTILPKNGKGARIVIDLAAADAETPPLNTPAKAPRIDLPAPHTTITGETVPAPAPLPKQAVSTPKDTSRARPTEPFEVAGAGQLSMLFDRTIPAEQSVPLELAQAGGISVHDWLRQEGTNPNVRTQQPVPQVSPSQPPAPPAYPARPVYRAPVTAPAPAAVPTRGAPVYPPAGTPAAQPQVPAYRPYGQGSYPPASSRPAASTHPSHPGYQRQPVTAAPTAGRHRQTGPASEPPSDNSPAARYASQKQAIPGEAQTVDTPRRFYAGLGFGFSAFEYETDRRNTTLDEDLTVWKLNAGYRFNNFLAAEISYGKVAGVDETVPNGNSAESLFYAFSASSLLYLPMHPKVAPFGRLGLSLWHEDADESAGVTSGTEESGVGLVLGLGVDYRLGRHFDIRGEWELNLMTDEAFSNNFTASVLYNF